MMKRLVSFFEIPAVKFGRAVDFYEKVFGVNLSVYECETEKMACFPAEDGLAPGAISWSADFKPSSSGVLVSLEVGDMEAALTRVEAGGGEVVIPKTKILAEGRGWFAVFADSEGNRIGLHSKK